METAERLDVGLFSAALTSHFVGGFVPVDRSRVRAVSIEKSTTAPLLAVLSGKSRELGVVDDSVAFVGTPLTEGPVSFGNFLKEALGTGRNLLLRLRRSSRFFRLDAVEGSCWASNLVRLRTSERIKDVFVRL